MKCLPQILVCILVLNSDVVLPTAEAAENFAGINPNDTILFIGDSITDGGRQRTGHDLNHIMGQCYAYIISAQIGAHLPERKLTFLNLGISGNKVTDLAGRWHGDALAHKPNLLSILIGVNDAGSVVEHRAPVVSAQDYESTYDQLLEQTRQALPGVRLVLCEPFVLPVGKIKGSWDNWSEEVRKRQQIVSKLASKYHAPVVHFQSAFNEACKRAPAEYWLWDGVHPTFAGHQLMAEEWMRVVNQTWPAK